MPAPPDGAGPAAVGGGAPPITPCIGDTAGATEPGAAAGAADEPGTAAPPPGAPAPAGGLVGAALAGGATVAGGDDIAAAEKLRANSPAGFTGAPPADPPPDPTP